MTDSTQQNREPEPAENTERPFPEKGRLGGIDFGTVRIGIAISDPGRSIASPHQNYNRQLPRDEAGFFAKLAASEELVGWVVGLPVHLSGNESQKSIEARAFGDWLAEATGIPVAFFDERFSSAFAEQMLELGGLTSKQRKKRRDMLAAQIILSAFLESDYNQQNQGNSKPQGLLDSDA